MSAKTSTPAVPPAPSFVAACKEYLGSDPEDLQIALKSGSEALGHLHELLSAIAALTREQGNDGRIKCIAEIGAYYANDICGYLDTEYGEMRHRMREAGLIQEVEQ